MARGATMVDFNGWHMPLYYRGITEEHIHTRSAAGLFDLCHMGRVVLSGARTREFADWLTPARLRAAKPGDVLYSFLLNERGCPIDDITVYLDDGSIMLVVNAGNHDRALEWIQRQAAAFGGVDVEDRSYSWAMIAVQGPGSDAAMSGFLGAKFEPLDYYTFRTVRGNPFAPEMLYSATGYTGEHGYEVYLPAASASRAWSALLEAGVGAGIQPVGLGARDSLRLEAAMPLYGHELNDETTPLEAGLGKFIDFEKPDFVGRDALVAQKESGGAARKLAGMEMLQRGPVPRQGHEVFSPDEERVGMLTSGIYSPSLQKNIALGYLRAPCAAAGTEVLVEIRGRRHPARVVKRPFYKRSA